MRYENFREKEYYHVFGKGVGEEKIFADDEDKVRFMFLLTHFQSPAPIYNVSWYTKGFLKKNSFSTQKDRINKIIKEKNVELTAFSVTSDRFHLLVRNLEEGVLSVYMHRILTAYSKYFNAKHNKKGHVFEGPYSAVRVKASTELSQLSAYIHKGLRGTDEPDSYEKYPYSSCQDYIGANRWGPFLSTDAILKQFKDQAKYRHFVMVSSTKSLYDL